MRKPVVLTVSLVALLVSVGCQTTLGTDFAKIKPGMEKAQVLDIVGSPSRTQRWRGLDRWTYFFFEQEAREEREVHFSQGVTSYVGERYRDPVSAEQQDESNEMANRAIEERIKLNREEASRNLENYENEMRGTESNPAYVPSFDPVQ